MMQMWPDPGWRGHVGNDLCLCSVRNIGDGVDWGYLGAGIMGLIRFDLL